MTVSWLVSNLTNETIVTLKDIKTRETVFVGRADEANFNYRVRDWNFKRGHIIYIEK